MKNIHLLPTEKPSVLILRQDGKLFFTGYGGQLGRIHGLEKDVPQNIYITSNEKPKKGEWSIYLGLQKKYKVIEDIIGDEFPKIILTTDQDLIADGVQSIDDEFLEWFIKNPSCERVEVDESNLLNTSRTYLGVDKYKIIIPQEELKKELIVPNGYYDQDCKDFEQASLDDFKEIETLEEAAENYSQGWGENDDVKSFIAGANYQAERMYSEQEVLELLLKSKIETSNLYYEDIKEWFEQFKNIK
jgi:hypothetical protein